MELKLRPSKATDGREVVKWIDGERQMRMWCRDKFSWPLTEAQMREYYRQLEEEENAWSFTALDETGRPVGSFRMTVMDYEKGHVHLGFIVLSPGTRGRGVGQKMVSMAVKYAVEFLGLKRVTLKVFDCNPAAKRCYEKVGFSEEEYIAEDFPFHEERWGNSLMVYESGRRGDKEQ